MKSATGNVTNAILVEDVHRMYRVGFWMKPKHVLQGVNIKVPAGSVFGFLGANGSGKTSLIQLIIGLKNPNQGRVSVFGHRANSIEARSQIGYLPERPYFYPHLTGWKFLHFYGALAGLTSTEVSRRLPQVLERVDLNHARDLELERYSKGMLQRIGIAQALLHEPKLLILDEPMSGLDPIGRKEVRELLRDLAKEGKTIFFTSHIIADVEALCDQVALIRDGQIHGVGPIGEFLSKGPLRTEIAAQDISLEEMQAIDGVKDVEALPVRGFRGYVSGLEDAQEAIRILVRKKATLLWVNPVRSHLEELFFEDKRRV